MMRRSASDLGSRHWFEVGSDADADGVSGKNVCILIYWICKADLSLLKKYGKAPGATTGKYQEHLDRVNGYNRGTFEHTRPI